MPQLRVEAPQQPLRVSMAVNADSLATWFLPALAPLLAQHPIELDLRIEDETRTLERLRQGEVFGAVSTEAASLPGCHASSSAAWNTSSSVPRLFPATTLPAV